MRSVKERLASSWVQVVGLNPAGLPHHDTYACWLAESFYPLYVMGGYVAVNPQSQALYESNTILKFGQSYEENTLWNYN